MLETLFRAWFSFSAQRRVPSWVKPRQFPLDEKSSQERFLWEMQKADSRLLCSYHSYTSCFKCVWWTSKRKLQVPHCMASLRDPSRLYHCLPSPSHSLLISLRQHWLPGYGTTLLQLHKGHTQATQQWKHLEGRPAVLINKHPKHINLLQVFMRGSIKFQIKG